MKFYAKVAGKDFIELFVHVSGTISRLAKVCVLHVSQDKLCFGTTHSRVMHEARVWCGEVRWGDFFHWFLMEGVSEEFKKTYLELASEHLFRTVRSTGNVPEVPVDPHCPYLIWLAAGGSAAAVAHSWDLPVCGCAFQKGQEKFPRA